MKLLIHDLPADRWEQISSQYEGWQIISDNGNIRPCIGCFSCWVKTPGECIFKDGYDHMASLVNAAEEIRVISRYTYGGFSSFVKNVFDRCISYVMPFFDMVEGEMHHAKRYPEPREMSFVFYGHNLSEEDEARAEKYVKAVCKNFRGSLKDVSFWESEEQKVISEVDEAAEGLILLNCSMRGNRANSRHFLERMQRYLKDEPEIINASEYHKRNDELIRKLSRYETVVMAMPLYVDGLSSTTIRILEKLETMRFNRPKKIYVLANLGFFESVQVSNLMAMMHKWCEVSGNHYGGGIAVGAGEVVGMGINSLPVGFGPLKPAGTAIRKLAEAAKKKEDMEDIYADSYAFLRPVYFRVANSNWIRTAKKNGLSEEDLYRQVPLSSDH